MTAWLAMQPTGTGAAHEGDGGCPPAYGRVAADMFMFGGLVCFLLTGVPYNGLLQMNLDRTFWWKQWDGTFLEVLPALVDAHGMAVRQLEEVLHACVATDIAEVVWQLCHPDPTMRGDPKARRFGHNPFGLTRYVSRLNFIHRHRVLRISSKRVSAFDGARPRQLVPRWRSWRTTARLGESTSSRPREHKPRVFDRISA